MNKQFSLQSLSSKDMLMALAGLVLLAGCIAFFSGMRESARSESSGLEFVGENSRISYEQSFGSKNEWGYGESDEGVVRPSEDLERKFSCEHEESNVGQTECTIHMLDQASAEREWKQRKLEAIVHPQINIHDMGGDLEEYKSSIREWRIGFESARDEWCEASVGFVHGSATPREQAQCALEIEMKAIEDLNDIHYGRILEYVYDSNGIADFEPSQADIDALVETNLTDRGCVWADDPACEN